MARGAARIAPPRPAPRRVEPFSRAMWEGLNSGTLERRLEAQALAEPEAPWRWGRIALGLAVGLVFAAVNQYVGLRTGLIVFGSWYVVLMAGLALRWRAAEVNLAAVAGGGANFIVGGFAYVIPALYLLASGPGALLAAPDVPVLVVATAGTALVGALGALGFMALRRAWVVEQPLPYPSFEQYLELLALTEGPRRGDLRRAARLLGASGLLAGAWAFARDFPLRGAALLKPLEGTGWYRAGDLQQPLASAQVTQLTLSLSPLLAAVGWFMRLRVALLVMLGSVFAWLVAVPLAVALGLPSLTGGDLAQLAAQGQPSAVLAFQGPVRALAAGAIVGGGVAALARARSLLGPALRASLRLRGAARDPDAPRAGPLALVTVVALPLLLVALGAPPLAALLVGALVVAGVFLLGAVAVKVAGETSLEPASASGFLLVLALLLALAVFGLPAGQAALLALLGAAVFFAGITMMGNLLLDLKLALYVGNRPRTVLRAAMLGIVPGAIVGGMVAMALGPALASGAFDAPAPQARAYATLVTASLAGQVPLLLIALGAAIGAFVEWRLRAGAIFGLGMFLPLGIPAIIVLGSAARRAWERRLDARGVLGEARELARADSYIVATGLMVGEALVGTAAAFALAFGA